MTGALTWYPANSADSTHPDEEADLTAIGSPGGAQWAWVADEGTGGPYGWTVYSRWLWEDIDADPGTELAKGTAASMAEGKAAVEAWVRLQAGYDAAREHHGDRYADYLIKHDRELRSKGHAPRPWPLCLQGNNGD